MGGLVPKESIEFVNVRYNEIWDVKVPKFIHDYHSWWPYWERERNIDMSQRLQEGMLLYDCGTFDGWLAAVYQKWVGGPQNIVLIEPSIEHWPLTKLTWEANGLGMPRATYRGFVSNREYLDEQVNIGKWPEGPDYGQIMKAIGFTLEYEEKSKSVTPCTTIDKMALFTGAPDAITLDVEGSEYDTIMGGLEIIKAKRPLIWISVHPEFMEFRYSVKPLKLHKLLYDLRYEIIPIATAHEEFWAYRPKERNEE